MSKIEDIRNNFTKMRGGKLISVESVVIAFIIFLIMSMKDDGLLYPGMFIGIIVAVVFPIIVGTFKTVAWLVAIIFSLLWALIGGVIGGAFFGGSALIALLIGGVIFLISFRIHKNYSGITFQNINKKNGSDVNFIKDTDFKPKESICFCPKCGRRITSADGTCDACDR